MPSYQVTFLTNSIWAKRDDDDRAVEWPPHPARLFAAFAAAFFEANEDAAERRALQWLESQDPPLIWAKGMVGAPRRLDAYVPANDVRGLAAIPDIRGQAGGKQLKLFTSASLSDPEVIYHWPEHPDPGVLHALDGIGSRVAYLGHSASLVRLVRTVAPETEPTWKAATRGTTVLRAPFPGMLDALRLAHARYERTGVRGPLPSVPVPYAKSHPLLAAARRVHIGLFDTLWSVRTTAGPHLPILATAGVTTAFHRAILARWGELAGRDLLPPIPEEVSGHAPDGTPSRHPHIAIVGLPAVGHPHSDGHLLGLALALPSSLADDVRRALWRVLQDIRMLTLRPGAWSLELLGRADRSDLPVSLLPRTWRGPARVWGSVTPVILDHYPRDLFGNEAEEIVRAACGRAGLPEPEVVAVRPTSLVPGAPPSRNFPGYPPGTAAPRVHAALEFSEPIAGPVVLGRGRFRGLGLFRPLGG